MKAAKPGHYTSSSVQESGLWREWATEREADHRHSPHHASRPNKFKRYDLDINDNDDTDLTVHKVALNGFWGNPGSWQDGVVPVSSLRLAVTIAPGVTSNASLGSDFTHEPFVAGRVAFQKAASQPSTLTVTNAGFEGGSYLKVGELYGGSWGNQNKVVVGTTSFVIPTGSRTSTLQVTDDAINVNFTITGINHQRDSGNGAVIIGERFHGSTFTFDGKNSGRLVLEHPPIGFITNEIDVTAFPQPNPVTGGSGPQIIELGGIQFDRADFIPYGPPDADGSVNGAVILSDQNVPVYKLINVDATGYGGAVGGHFSVGMNDTTHLNYVAYSR